MKALSIALAVWLVVGTSEFDGNMQHVRIIKHDNMSACIAYSEKVRRAFIAAGEVKITIPIFCTEKKPWGWIE